MSAITHPVVGRAEFAARMEHLGWDAPMELIAGEVVFVEPSGGNHSFAQIEIARALPGGRVLTDVFVAVGEAYLGPDVAWWSAEREPEIGPGAIATVPDLVAEVLSPRTRDNDLGAERRIYLEAGVTELWLVDTDARTVLVVTAAHERRFNLGDTIASSVLP